MRTMMKTLLRLRSSHLVCSCRLNRPLLLNLFPPIPPWPSRPVRHQQYQEWGCKGVDSLSSRSCVQDHLRATRRAPVQEHRTDQCSREVLVPVCCDFDENPWLLCNSFILQQHNKIDLFLRPLLPTDAKKLKICMISSLFLIASTAIQNHDVSSNSLFLRFNRPIHDVPDELLTYLTNIDYDYHYAVSAGFVIDGKWESISISLFSVLFPSLWNGSFHSRAQRSRDGRVVRTRRW